MAARGFPNGQALPRNIEQRHFPVVSHRPLPEYTISNRSSAPNTNPRFPHIKDLQAKADWVQGFNPHTPIRTLLEQAQQSASQANANISFGKPDRAYVEYLCSSNILLEIIPRHKDFPTLNSDREGWRAKYRDLCKQNDKQYQMFRTIYNMIVDDNRDCGTTPALQIPARSSSRDSKDPVRQITTTSLRPLSMPPTPTSNSDTSDELFMPLQPPYSSSPQKFPRASGSRPVVQPKPQALQGRPKTINGNVEGMPIDALAERFTQLRVPRKEDPIMSHPNDQAIQDGEILEMPSPTEYTKPAGPRSMPPPPHHSPPPPKTPLDVSGETVLPRAPSPAYDPSKTVVSPRSTTHRKSQIIGPSIPQKINNGGVETDGFHARARLAHHSYDPPRSTNSSRPSSAEYSHPTSISTERLFDMLREYYVLVIDVRSREEFDYGHMHATSIMCVEPVSLRSGLSAEEFEETLVVSPPAELEFFERRDEFDYIVYYDQHTSSESFLAGPPNSSTSFAMRALHDTIHEFNYYKPLRRPPLMLRGGLDAWIDMVGNNGLAQSNTAALIGSTRPRRPAAKSGRPIGRVPMASQNSSLEVRRRRLREHTPLNADEEKSWLERARNEGVEPAEYQHAQSDGEEDVKNSHAEEPPSPFVRSYEEFLQTFPEVSSIQQSMTEPLPPPPSRPPPPMPPAMPSIPSRPPPAAPRPSYSGVSDRNASQISPASRAPASAQPPLYTSRNITHYLKLPRTGLVNFGVTCYMNATVQCLLATIPLSQFFLDNRWRDYVVKNWKGSNGIMPEIYANLIRSLWKGDVQSVRPITLRRLCARLNPEWGLDRQQDAKEYLDFLLDCLHEDLNQRWDKQPLVPLTIKQELTRERMPIQEVSKIEWQRYSHREASFISNLFAGQHASRLRCTTCKNTSTTYEAFYSISVEIPQRGKGADIHDCLRSYCQEERLSKDEMWKCPHCKCQREATKQIIITRAPQFLVVHFKRFSAGKNESTKKVHTPIHFPLHGLNIESYMVPSLSASKGREHFPDEHPDAAVTPPFLYDAYAVMRHLGASGNGGHYISLVRDAARGCWRKFDDDRVSDFDPSRLKSDQRLQNEQAYLVFYGRQVAR
ncbi:MAG: hypothetical protein LQ343_007809 [Gyalolechia ehrenbergii]|nr:MAG: hypothetical protein LQ343_007809 [Gyalolechia ehrenbergii]